MKKHLWIGCLAVQGLFALQIQDVEGDWRKKAIDKELYFVRQLEDVKEFIATHERDPSTQIYHIQNNRLTTGQLGEVSLEERDLAICNAINNILALKTLPDMTFLVHLGDAFLGREDHIPIFVFSKLKNQKCAMLIPDFEMFTLDQDLFYPVLEASHLFPWSEKQNLAFWRGSTTGGDFSRESWRNYPRSQLVLKARNSKGLVNARFTRYIQGAEHNQELMQVLGPPASYVSIPTHLAFKYLIDIDGNASTYSRYFWILLSNSMPLKVESNFTQWYYAGLEPYKHYVPVESNCLDLLEQVQWAITHDSEAERIAKESQDFAKQYLDIDGVYTYLYHLLKAYGEST